MLNIGEVVLHYRIVELLGRGETGVVYKAEDQNSGRLVALKVFEWSLPDGSSDVARLRKEAAAAQALRHPNICQVEAIEASRGLLCVVMELLDGTSLDVLINRRPLPTPTLIAYACDIASALDAAHKRAILHHDLKPSKLVVTSTGIKVLDFGIGWIIKQARHDPATKAEALGFALSYASPEQLRGEAKDSRSDLFSFGAVLYEMATGQPPFRAAGLFEEISKIQNETPTLPRQLNGRLPRDLERIILKALEKDREARYPSAAEMLAALRDVSRHVPPASATPIAAASPTPSAIVSAPPSPLRTIGRYEIVRLIAEGGMGAVYLGRDPAIDRLVAIKWLRGDTQAMRDLFAREGRAVGRLKHPNIVSIFDVGEYEGQPFIAMEYVEGRTLADLIRRQVPMPLARKLQVMEAVCSALHYAHRAGIVHRDVKPANVMVDDEHLVKILDFGIAQVLASGKGGASWAIDGTLGYMSPEQLQGTKNDSRSDMFAAGAMFYELLSYRRAFPGDVQSIVNGTLIGRPEPLDLLAPALDRDLIAVVNRCLEKQPDKRYADMGEVRSAVATIRQRLETSGVTGSGAGAMATLVVAPPTAPPAASPAVLTASSRRPAGAGLWAAADDPEIVDRALDVALPSSVPVLTPMEIVALLRLTESPSLATLLAEEGATDLSSRSRNFGMEFVRDARGWLKPTTVTMRVTAPDFDPPRIEKTVRVRPDRDSERQTFLLTPKALGRLRIQFDVVAANVALASRSLETTAEPSDRLSAATPPVVASVPLEVTVIRRSRFRLLPTAAAVLIVAGFVLRVFVSREAPASRPAPTPPIAAPVERAIRRAETTEAQAIQRGPFQALVIGIDQYASLPALATAVHDAEAVEAALRERYSFKTELLRNPTRYEILSALNRYRTTLPEHANLLIYYAGHGHFDKEADKAYWLPADAQADNSANWIIADDITSDIRVIPAKHILVISDSCYSGGLTRDVGPVFTPQERGRYLQKMEAGRSRTLLASGGNEPVSDRGGVGDHSVFAAAVLKGLDAMPSDTFTAHELFANYIGISVAGRSQQTPQYSLIRNSGHDSGDFVFVRKSGG